MFYTLNNDEMLRFEQALKTAIAIPFIDDIEDYIVEAIWAHSKSVEVIDPFYNIRSKKLYDVVDHTNQIGWSVKSIQWAFSDECEFELVIQRADVYKKCAELGFPALTPNSAPNEIGAALLTHWNKKIDTDAITQGVHSKRVFVLLKTVKKKNYAIFEEDIKQYGADEIEWRWTNDNNNGLQGFRKTDNMCVYRWYPSQKQFFERFILPAASQKIQLIPKRLDVDQVAEVLAPYLQEQE